MNSIPSLALWALALVGLTPMSSIASPGIDASPATGQLVLDTVHGRSLENTVTGESPDRTVAVYLPPSYTSSPDRRYPVLYLLHGIGGTHQDWTEPQNDTDWNTIQAVMDRGIVRGAVAEMIVVAPNEMTRGGGSFYTNSVVTGDWETFTVTELVEHVDTTYRTLARAESRGIAGHSMGGYGAIKLGMKHPDVFQAVYGLNSALLGWAADISAENDAYARAARARPESLNPREDVYVPSLLCVAQAFSPDPDRPPFFVNLPFMLRDGSLEPSDPAHEQWTRNMPLYMVEDYQENLGRLRGLRFDSGRDDRYTHIPVTNLALSERLAELGIDHIFEDYNGGHVDRLWGEEGRMGAEVLPWFSRVLDLE